MNLDLDALTATLRTDHLADPAGIIKPAGRAELSKVIDALRKNGHQARVAVLPPGTDLTTAHPLWGRLGLTEPRDLLLLFNGQRWEARGWKLNRSQIDAALSAARPSLAKYYAAGLASALLGLGAAADVKTATTPVATSTGRSGGGLFVGGALAVGGGALGFIIMRRRRLQRQQSRAIHSARGDAERVFAEVILATEDLPEADAAPLRDRASRLKDELDALPAPQKALPPAEESFTRARFDQLENELEALRSVVLQKKRRA